MSERKKVGDEQVRSYITTDEMDMINSYSRRQLSSDDVYVFTVKLCDNDIDRANERFTVESLFVLKKLFIGKTGIIDRDQTAKNQMARILSCDVEYIEDKVTAVGEPYYQLIARAYLLRNDDTRELIDSIENSTVKKVSTGCSVRRSVCSICHCDIHSPLCNHRKGKMYKIKGRVKKCFVELQEPTDAYEFTFVVEPKNELKPCPFCGSEPIINEIPPHKHYFVDLPDYEGGCFIECKCSCAISAKNRKEAIEKWNRRVK